MSQHYYAIFSGRSLLPSTIRMTRREAITHYTADRGDARDWAWLRQHGHRVAKVRITEIAPTPIGATPR